MGKFEMLVRGGNGAYYYNDSGALVATDRRLIAWHKLSELRAEDDKLNGVEKGPECSIPLVDIMKIIGRYNEGRVVSADAMRMFAKAAKPTRYTGKSLIGVINRRYVLAEELGEPSEVYGESKESEAKGVKEFLVDSWYLKKFVPSEKHAVTFIEHESSPVLRYVHIMKGVEYEVLLAVMGQSKVEEVRELLSKGGLL